MYIVHNTWILDRKKNRTADMIARKIAAKKQFLDSKMFVQPLNRTVKYLWINGMSDLY